MNVFQFRYAQDGVGPSSSHTLGPWRAAERWIKELKAETIFNQIERVKIDLYGSLSLTEKDTQQILP